MENPFLMGTDFSVEGIVEHGRGMGHKYLLPTTNLIPPVEKLMPPNGFISQYPISETEVIRELPM